MTGTDFFNLAVALHAKGGPAETRSATSRAYYGAFHRAQELLVSIGIRLPQGPECHTKLRWILEQAGDPDVTRASSKLNSLREARNDADYNLTATKPEGNKTVAVNLATAEEIMDCIELCFADRPKAGVHASMKAYARETLKLGVS